eukprot:g446.t1
MDADLAAARAKSAGAGGQSNMSGEMQKIQAQQKKKQEYEEMKKAVLKQLLTPEARHRLSTIALVKPQKAASLEHYLMQNARTLRRVDEKKLKGLLDSMASASEAKVVIKRRTYSDSEDDNDDDLL